MIGNSHSSLARIAAAIKVAIDGISVAGKIGKKYLQPVVGQAIERNGFKVDYEDSEVFLGSALPVWRDKNSMKVEQTVNRRKIDIVVYDTAGCALALIETESDLDDLKQHGVSKRNGHYDVFSIARDASGKYFHSYKSLERMAAGAFYRSARNVHRVDELGAIQRLESLSSDDPLEHNPLGLGLFLVTGRSRPQDRKILDPRLRSLNAVLLSRG